MSRSITAITAILLALIAVAGCGQAASPTPTHTPTSAPASNPGAPATEATTPWSRYELAPSQTPTDTIVIGTTERPTSLDPAGAWDFHAWEVLAATHEGLMRRKVGSLDVEPALATGYEISDDGATYTFRLREGARFADGTPITAQTFVDSIRRVLDLGLEPASLIEPYVESVEAPDDTTVVFHLIRPLAYFPTLVATPPYLPAHPDVFQAGDYNPFPDGIPGNGMYTVESYDHDELALRANPNYDGEPPATANVIVRYFDMPTDVREALLAGQVDLEWRSLYLTDVDALSEIDGLQIIREPTLAIHVLAMNHSDEPFDNPAARRAISVMVDREALAEYVYGDAVIPLHHVVPPQFTGFADLEPRPQDLAAAEEILAEAGFRRYHPLEINLLFSSDAYGDREGRAARELYRQFRQIEAIRFSMRDMEWASFRETSIAGDMEICLLSWRPRFPDPGEFLRPFAASEQSEFSGTFYSNPEMDALLRAAESEIDPDERLALYRRALELFEADSVVIPLWQETAEVIARVGIEGIEIEPDYMLRFGLLSK